MPWNYRIDEERRLVITTAWDRLSGPDISDHQHALLNDPAFERDFFQFLDLGDVIEALLATRVKTARGLRQRKNNTEAPSYLKRIQVFPCRGV